MAPQKEVPDIVKDYLRYRSFAKYGKPQKFRMQNLHLADPTPSRMSAEDADMAQRLLKEELK